MQFLVGPTRSLDPHYRRSEQHAFQGLPAKVGKYGWYRLILSAILTLWSAGAAYADQHVEIITFTQTGCQFVEPEGTDHGFTTNKAMDCVEINSRTGNKRLDDVRPLRLKPGRYIFRVANKNVPYELGFYLRAASRLKVPFKPKVSGGGLLPGVTKDYVIDLTEGDYVYSCPLNPTPDYPVTVAE